MMTEFTLYPAIDLRRGQVVRLKQGDPDRQTMYDSHPGNVARRWLDDGARWLHVVNLDGAFEEQDTPNQQALEQILGAARSAEAHVQFGGGIRSLEDIQHLLSLGVSRVILGTAAAHNPDMAREAVQSFGEEHIVAGIDARDGVVQIRGWTEETALTPIAFGSQLGEKGLTRAVYTDITRDGMSRGLNVKAARIFQENTGLDVISAGGVSSLEDIQSARDAGLRGVIIGRALYEGHIDLARALERFQGGI